MKSFLFHSFLFQSGVVHPVQEKLHRASTRMTQFSDVPFPSWAFNHPLQQSTSLPPASAAFSKQKSGAQCENLCLASCLLLFPISEPKWCDTEAQVHWQVKKLRFVNLNTCLYMQLWDPNFDFSPYKTDNYFRTSSQSKHPLLLPEFTYTLSALLQSCRWNRRGLAVRATHPPYAEVAPQVNSLPQGFKLLRVSAPMQSWFSRSSPKVTLYLVMPPAFWDSTGGCWGRGCVIPDSVEGSGALRSVPTPSAPRCLAQWKHTFWIYNRCLRFWKHH